MTGADTASSGHAPRVVAVVPTFDPGPGLARLLDQITPQVTTVVVGRRRLCPGLDLLAALEGRPGVHLLRRAHSRSGRRSQRRSARSPRRPHAPTGAHPRPGLGRATGLRRPQRCRPGGSPSPGHPRRVRVGRDLQAAPAPTRGRRAGFAIAFDPMQSGCLVPATTFRARSAATPTWVIDAVDSELTVRCRAAGLVPVVGPGCHLEHGMGERASVRRFGRELAYNRHSPQRVYYMARNGNPAHRPVCPRRAWLGAAPARRGGQGALPASRPQPRPAPLARAALAGMRDGLRGRTGPAPRPPGG